MRSAFSANIREASSAPLDRPTPRADLKTLHPTFPAPPSKATRASRASLASVRSDMPPSPSTPKPHRLLTPSHQARVQTPRTHIDDGGDESALMASTLHVCTCAPVPLWQSMRSVHSRWLARCTRALLSRRAHSERGHTRTRGGRPQHACVKCAWCGHALQPFP